MNKHRSSSHDNPGNPEASGDERPEAARRSPPAEGGESEDLFHLLVDRVEDYAIFMLDPHGRIISWNEGARRIKGYEKEEILGHSIARFYTAEDVERGHPARLLEYAEANGRVEDEGWRVRKDGGRFWADVIITALRDDKGRLRGFGKVTRDLTERMRAESETRARARQQAGVASLGQRALSGTELQPLFSEACTVVTQTLEATFCRIMELLPDGKSLMLRAGSGWKEGHVGATIIAAGADSQAEYTLISDKPARVQDLRAEQSFKAPHFLLEHGIVGGITAIIGGRQRPFGVLGVHTTERREFSVDDVNFLQSVANVLAEAIERKRTEDAARHLSRRLLQLQDGEQRRIGRDLHAMTAPSLDSLCSQLSIVQKSGIVFDWKTSTALETGLKLAGEVAKQVRDLANLLYPRLLEESGLVEAIRWCAGGLSQRSGIKVVMDLPPRFNRLTLEAERTLFRVVQESLANVQRHSGGRTAQIRLSEDAYAVCLEVKDDGKGMPPSVLNASGGLEAVSGVGIPGMIERLRQLAGRLEIDSGSWGTKVTATLPLSSARGRGSALASVA